jgi:hypothetical protein
MITEAEKEIILHSIFSGNRGHFVVGSRCSSLHLIESLIQKGMIVEVDKPRWMSRSERLFRVTQKGKEVIYET